MGRVIYKIRLLSFILLFGVTGCVEVIDSASICSKDGGTCCAMGSYSSEEGELEYTSFICTATQNECAMSAESSGLDSSWPYDNKLTVDDKGRCGLKTEYVPFWEDMNLLKHNVDKLEINAEEKQQYSNYSKLEKSKPDFCRSVCSTDSLGLCPRIGVPNDFGLGLLNLTVELAESPEATTQVLTIDDLYRKFKILNDSNQCERGDITTSPTIITNYGDEICTTSLRNNSIGYDFKGELLVQEQFLSHPNLSVKVAEFSALSNSQTLLKVEDEIFSPKYNGNIRSAGRFKSDKLFVHVTGNEDTGCAQIVPLASSENKLLDTIKLIEEKPSVAKAAVSHLETYMESLGSDITDGIKTEFSSVYFPIGQILNTVNSQANKTGYQTYVGEDYSSTNGLKANSIDVLNLIDVALCREAFKDTGASDMMASIPWIDLNNIDSDLMTQRHDVSGQIINCKYSSEIIPDSVLPTLINAFVVE